jgi:hypothetical protein
MTVRWNNILTVALGTPMVFYVIWAFTSGAWTTRGGMIGLSIIGVLY